MSDFKFTIAIDFDGVIHRYSKGWHDGTVYDEPMEGVREGLEALQGAGFTLVIYTTRDVADVQTWLDVWDLSYLISEVSNTKPLAVLLIDDRAYRFKDWTTAAPESLSLVDQYRK